MGRFFLTFVKTQHFFYTKIYRKFYILLEISNFPLASVHIETISMALMKMNTFLGLTSTCNFAAISSTRENHANVNIGKYFMTYIDMLFQLNGAPKYMRNNEIMSNFSRDTTIVAFYWPSFILQSQCALYFRVCSISWLFLCAMNINESVISITLPGSRHGKLTLQ